MLHWGYLVFVNVNDHWFLKIVLLFNQKSITENLLNFKMIKILTIPERGRETFLNHFYVNDASGEDLLDESIETF